MRIEDSSRREVDGSELVVEFAEEVGGKGAFVY